MEFAGEHLADALEIYLITLPQVACSDYALQKFASEVLGVSEPEMSFCRQLMRRRAQFLDDSYPFRFEPGAVVRRSACTSSQYGLMLAASVVTRSALTDLAELETHFDQLVLDSLCSWLGRGSSGVVFAWPPVGGRPTGFSEAISWLAERMGMPLGHGFRSPAQKDGGVDVVAWKAFDDKRSGFPIVLAQCTLQQDVVPKVKDIDLDLWKELLNVDISPLPVLATPQVLNAASPSWNAVGRRCIPFDRIRILRTLERGASTSNSESRDRAVQKVLDVERRRLETG